MRVSRAEMDKSHQRIVERASRLMRKNGIETTSVNDVMSAAGLTHGGFYRHFESKDALVKAALEAAFVEALQTIDEIRTKVGSKDGVQDYISHYLSQGHLSHPELGCPVSALGVEVARATPEVKATFTSGFNRVIDKLAEPGPEATEDSRQAALVKFALLAGAVVIARATEPGTGQSVLYACRQALAHSGI